jgi:hypothetical protein
MLEKILCTLKDETQSMTYTVTLHEIRTIFFLHHSRCILVCIDYESTLNFRL